MNNFKDWFKYENNAKSVGWKQGLGFMIFLFVFYIFATTFIGDSPSPSSTYQPSTTNSQSNFSNEVRARFDEILSVSPELQSIDCLNYDCNNSVVYFNYKTLPSDLEFAIRGNTATFSKFKLEKKGVSHVSIIATYNGRELFTCRASQGVVSECK